MDLIDVPFTQIRPGDIARPYLPITIKNPHTGKSTKLYGLLDTGADECAIPAGYAPLIGHNLQSGHSKQINTGNGITTAYGHTLCFEINGLKIDDVIIDFLPNLNIALLGVKSFLSNFVVTIDYKRKTFSLKQHT
jgi:predicted aspartyl protease